MHSVLDSTVQQKRHQDDVLAEALPPSKEWPVSAGITSVPHAETACCLGTVVCEGRDDTPEDAPPIVPFGCHWFRDCLQCGWDDCIVETPVPYDSPDGRRLRGACFRDIMREFALSPAKIGEFFHVTAKQVSGDVKVAQMVHSSGRLAYVQQVQEVKKRRQAGESIDTIAAALGVCRRTVLYMSKKTRVNNTYARVWV